MPYNEAAGAKYEWLGQEYRIVGGRQSAAELERWVARARALGLAATVS